MAKSGSIIERLLNTILEKNGIKHCPQITDPIISVDVTTTAIIGRKGVGKTSTVHSLFDKSSTGKGSWNLKTREDGVEEIVYEDDYFKISVIDMPGIESGLNNNSDVLSLYKTVLPSCNSIIYIIDSCASDIDRDIEIIKNKIVPIIQEARGTHNIVIAFNKIDSIGQLFPEYNTNKEYHWDRTNNKPTATLSKLIEDRLMDIYSWLIKENVQVDLVSPVYSAECSFGLNNLLYAILDLKNRQCDGSFLNDTKLAKWSDKKLKEK